MFIESIFAITPGSPSSIAPIANPPATCTLPQSPPPHAEASLKNVSVAPAFERSIPVRTSTFPAPSSSHPSGSESENSGTATCAPSRNNRRTTAVPSAPVPPVTTTVRPLKRSIAPSDQP